MRNHNTKTIAFYGLMVALALILSYLEAQIPAFFAVPGMKLGITNVVVLIVLYSRGAKSALCINLLRIFLVGVLFGNGMSLLFSLTGGLLSGAVMILLKKTGRFSVVPVSIMGGICHNIGQILTAMVVLQTRSLGWYLLILWFTGMITGAVIGIVGGELCRRLTRFLDGGAESK